MAPQTPFEIIISGFTYHPLCFKVYVSMSYIVCLVPVCCLWVFVMTMCDFNELC